MVADVLQRPLHVARRPEVGARGAAIVAMDVAGIAYDPVIWTASDVVIEPRRETAQHYKAGFARYLDTVSAARSLWNRDQKT